MVAPEEVAALIAVTVAGLAVLSITPIGRALARRLSGTGDAETQREVLALREEVEILRGELDTMQNRMDFAERVIAQKDKTALPGAR